MKLNSAPLFVHFPPTGKRKAQDTMDLQRFLFCNIQVCCCSSALLLVVSCD